MPRNVLIIKTGFSEFLDRGISTTVSLGDVLICTSLLHLYKNDHVTWVGDWQARRLLEKNPLIKRLLIFDSTTLNSLRQEQYDILINLEKDIGICASLNQIKAGQKYGFYYDDALHNIAAHEPSTQYLLAGQEHHNGIHKNAFEILYETVGAKWEGQGLILSAPSGTEQYDIGLNHAVGTKWPTKAWPMNHWKSLEGMLKGQYSLSWQQGHEDLSAYVQWINSCRLIVTSDSLGQAIGQALNKKVITLYGPTNPMRMRNVPNVTVLSSTYNCSHMPCFLPVCKFEKSCMDYITPERVAQTCKELLESISLCKPS